MKMLITLPAPIANKGDSVLVLNYRVRPPEWEVGRVVDMEYSTMHAKDFKLTYTIGIDRPVIVDGFGRRRGGGYRLYVGPDKVRRAV
jgi:hypothetical protein